MEQFNELITKEDIDQLSQSEGLSFDDDSTSILESMQSIDVQACPGGGKTTLISAKLMLLAKKWPLSGQGICVLSHTNVAKDEIIKRLKRSKTTEAQRLLSYPHFIGTIQEFVNKFIAIPYIRSEDKEVSLICGIEDQKPYFFQSVKELNIAAQIKSKFLIGPQSYQFSSSQLREESLSTVHLSLDQSKICYFQKPNGNTVQRNFDNDLNSTEINQGNILYKIKRHMTDTINVFSYNDMYMLAAKALSENYSIPMLMCKRFPFVLIDEMQDTQKFQDELLCQVFPLDVSSVIIQRFGDPDQAIFHGIGNEESNESFNGKQADDMSFVVNKSHRFDVNLASKIKPLSVNQIQLSTEMLADGLASRLNACSQQEGFQHSIIIFDDSTVGGVVKSFADVVSEQFQGEYKASERFTVKAVGAVGNEIDPSQEQLKIGHYWHSYDKKKAKAFLTAASLIDVIRHVRQVSTLDFSENYKVLTDGIIKWLSLSEQLDENSRRFTPKSLQKFLQEKNKWITFRERTYFLLTDDSLLLQEHWEEICTELKRIFELQDLPDAAKQYLSFSENTSHDEDINDGVIGDMCSLTENKIRHREGFDIHLSTIHGVKGETHDATLIMETKNHCFDLEAMLPYMTNNLPNAEHPQENLPDKPHHSRGFKPNKLFSRQLYVAASRPRHLLCVAMHTNRITDEQREKLTHVGWKVIPLSQEGDAT